MTWKRLFRWFVRAALAGFVLLAIAAGVVWYVIRADEAESWGRSCEGRIATALGWERTADIEQRLRKKPELVLALLGNDSHRVCEAAQRFFRREEIAFGDTTLDAIAAEIRAPDGLDRTFLVKLLAASGENGVQRLMDLYRAATPVDSELQRAVSEAVENVFGHSSAELVDGLIAIVGNDSGPRTNRCLAAEALGFMGKPNGRYDPKDYRFAVIASLQERLSSFPQPIAVSLGAALKRIEDEDVRQTEESARRTEENRSAADRELESLSEDGHEAIAALSDQDDWWRVGRAADALARQGVTRAIPALQQVAASHWYRPVRKTAQRAIRVLQGQEPYLLEPDGLSQPKSRLHDLRWYLEEEIQQWNNVPHRGHDRNFLENAFENLQRVWRAWQGLIILPRITEVEYRRVGRLPRRMVLEDVGMERMRPTCAGNYAGGKLLGYDHGEWGCALVFYRKGEVPQFLGPLSVTDFVQMPFGMLIMTFQEGLFVATQSADGDVTIAPFKKHLPLGPQDAYQEMANGELRFECLGGDTFITPTGDLRFVEFKIAGDAR